MESLWRPGENAFNAQNVSRKKTVHKVPGLYNYTLRFMIHAGMRSLPAAPQGGALGRGFGFLEMGIAAVPNK